jgi:hypothetical protein
MLDLIFVVATAVFFAVAILYVHGCDRLRAIADPELKKPKQSGAKPGAKNGRR